MESAARSSELGEPDLPASEQSWAFVTAFQSIANYFGRPSSPTVLFSGFPIDLSKPAVDDIERASARIGLEAKPFQGRLHEIDRANLPLLIMHSGVCFAVLEETDDQRFKTSGEFADKSGVLSKDDLKKIDGFTALSFSAIYLNNDERSQLGEGSTIENQHWLRNILAPFWGAYVYVAVAALFINLIGLASPIFIMNVYDRILPNQAMSSLWVLCFGMMIALGFDLLLKTARAALIDHTGREADHKLAYTLFEKVLHSKLSSRPSSTGEFASRLGQYEFVREFFTSNTIGVLIDAAFIFIFLAVIYSLTGWIAIIPAIAFLLALFVGLIAQYRIGKRVARAANEAAERNALLVESVATLETVKSLRAESHLLRKWSELTKNSSRTSEDIKQISSGASNLTSFIQQGVSIAVVVAGAYAFSAGEITTGAIIATVMLASRTVSPLAQITMTLSRMRQAILSLKILDGIMLQPEDRPSSTGFVNREISKGSVTFEGVEFIYPETDNPVLSKINFKIKAGERVGIIGKIGSGKTTLGKLIGGLFDVNAGRILIDGIDVRQYHPHEVRKSVAFMGQSADLFSGTLKENLLVARPNATDDELIEAARKAGVDEFASRHPRGYDMPVGERGDRLSGGQKQAVTIARLLMNNPQVVFLDEPSGAMDVASERRLVANLNEAFPADTTVIISTHRYSLLDMVDRIIVLDNGRLVADGPKKEVMSTLASRANSAKAKKNKQAAANLAQFPNPTKGSS